MFIPTVQKARVQLSVTEHSIFGRIFPGFRDVAN